MVSDILSLLRQFSVDPPAFFFFFFFPCWLLSVVGCDNPPRGFIVYSCEITDFTEF